MTTFIPACEQSFGGRVRLWGFFNALLSGCSGQTALDCECPCGVERSLCQAVWVSESLTKLLSNMLCSITSSEWLTDGLSTAASCQQTCLLMLRSRFLRAADWVTSKGFSSMSPCVLSNFFYFPYLSSFTRAAEWKRWAQSERFTGAGVVAHHTTLHCSLQMLWLHFNQKRLLPNWQ